MIGRTRRQFLQTVIELTAPVAVSLAATPSAALLAADDPKGTKGTKGTAKGAEAAAKELENLPTTDAEWRKLLTSEQYKVLRKKHTEKAFSGKYWNSKKHGVFRCAGCGQTLFDSDTKFNSGTGWPSFWLPVDEKVIDTRPDLSELPARTEVICSRCQGHLGHVFGDGPPPSGLRFCINSAALKLEERPAPPKGAKNATGSKGAK